MLGQEPLIRPTGSDILIPFLSVGQNRTRLRRRCSPAVVRQAWMIWRRRGLVEEIEKQCNLACARPLGS